MHMINGFRKYSEFLCTIASAAESLQRKYFPPTEYDLTGEDWEEMEFGESAENGAPLVKAEAQTQEDEAAKVEASGENTK